MCVYSMVVDQFQPVIPWIEPEPSKTIGTFTWPKQEPTLDLNELKKLLDEFKRLVENAKEIDAKTGQPDCVDPEKAKLIDRVIELEKLIANPPEFVIVKGAMMHPGTYRVVDGKLYKAFE